MRWRGTVGFAGLVGLVLLLAALAGCRGGAEGDGGADPPSGLRGPTGSPRPVVFEPGQLVWAQGSTIHAGDRTYDVGPELVQAMSWTPYGLYLRVARDPDTGPYREVFFDGTTMQPVPDVYGFSDVITSPDGRLAAWIDLHGPESPAGRVAQVVVVDTATGERVFEDSEGMGGDPGDDLADLYEDASPDVIALTDTRLVWRTTVGNFPTVATDLTTGETAGHAPPVRRVGGRSAAGLDVGHRRVGRRGWLGDDTMVVLTHERGAASGDLLVCDLGTGRCERRVEVVGAREVVLPDVPDVPRTA